MLQAQKPSQPCLLVARPLGHVDEGFNFREQCATGDHQHLHQIVRNRPPARIFNDCEVFPPPHEYATTFSSRLIPLSFGAPEKPLHQ
jgi:hypothetical protein